MDRNKREKLKRQATAAAVATVASASVMVGGILPDDGVFDDGAEDFPTPIVETVPLRGAGGDAPETQAEAAAESEEEKKKAQRAAAWFARLPFGARVLVAAGIGGAAWLTASGASALLAAALPTAAAAVLGWGLTVLALAAGLAAFVKAFFPEKKLRDIVKKKNLWWLLGGAAALLALDEMLPLVWAGYSTAAAFVKLAGGAAILGGTVTAAVRGEKRREREAEEAAIEAPEEPKPETMEEARRRVLRMADETAEFRF